MRTRQTVTLTSSAPTSADVLTALASAASSIAVNSQKITGLAAGAAGTDAVNLTQATALAAARPAPTAAEVVAALASAASSIAVNSQKITGLLAPTAGSTNASTALYSETVATTAAQLPANALVALAAAAGSVSVNSQKITNLLAGTLASDAARLDQAAMIPTAVKTADYTAVAGDLVLVDTTSGVVIVTLPTAVGAAGKRIGIKRTTGTNNITLATTSSQTIDGLASGSSALQFLGLFPASGASMTLFSDGSNWFRLQAPANTVSSASTSATVDNSLTRFDSTGGRAVQSSDLSVGDTASSQTALLANVAATGLLLQGNVSTATTPGVDISNQNSFTASSGVQVLARIVGTVNQTSTAGVDCLLVNPTLTAVGSTGANLLRLQSGSADRLRVDNSGNLFQSSTATTGHRFYNTSDETTNTEYIEMKWASNLFSILSSATGTGTTRAFRVNTGNATFTMSAGQGTSGTVLSGSITNVATDLFNVNNASSWNSTSLVQNALSVTGTVNQASGTGGFNALLINPTLTAVGSTGANLLRLQAGSVDMFRITSTGQEFQSTTTTAAGTTGNATINKPTGTVNIAAAGTSVTVTNSLVSTTSLVFCTLRTNDSTATIKNVVASAGSFVITLTAAATAEVSIGFRVVN